MKKISKYTGAKMALWGIAAGFFGMVIAGHGLMCLRGEAVFDVLVPVVMGVPMALCVWRLAVNYRVYKSPVYQRIQENARQQTRDLIAQERELKRRSADARSIREEIERQDRTPVAAVLLSTKDITGKSVGSTAARAAVGYALFGVFGAGVGMTTAKTKVVRQMATFSVRYESGRTAVRTVEVGSQEYRELAKLLVS